jgi:hypothetical protein
MNVSVNDRTCDHAGDCVGCGIKQVDCFSYAVYLTRKYRTLAVKTASKLDAWKDYAKSLEEKIASYAPCWACQEHYLCKSAVDGIHSIIASERCFKAGFEIRRPHDDHVG